MNKRWLMPLLFGVCLTFTYNVPPAVQAEEVVDIQETEPETVAAKESILDAVEVEPLEIMVPVEYEYETEPEAETEAAVEVDEHDLYILAHLLCGECQGSSWECQIAVGSVVLNRVADSGYPNSIEGVVFQRGQYACTWDGNYDRTPTDRNWEVARYLLENGSQIPSNVIYQAQFKQGHGVWNKIGGEIFCYK